MGNVQARLTIPSQMAVAADDARLVVRTPGNQAVNFLIIGDDLIATVTPKQAEYFAQIEGYDVDGYEPVKRDRKVVKSWADEGARLKAEKESGAQRQSESDPVAALLALLGGPEALLKMLAGNVVQNTEQVAALAAREEATRLAAAEEYERTRDWDVRDARKLADEQLFSLMQDHLPHVDTSAMNTIGMAANLASTANSNPELSAELVTLLGDATTKSAYLSLKRKPVVARKSAAEKSVAAKPAAKRTPTKRK